MATNQPTVVLKQGTYKGKLDQNPDYPVPIEAWLGIRYAQAPLGELRFARPKPLPASNDTLAATEFGYRCPGKQLLAVTNLPEPSEDCLTVNVFRQQDSGNAKPLPVMVYLHGGAFNRGTAAMHNTGGMVAHSAEPFIGVSFNYRLGALGFLNSQLTAKEGVLNLGLHDQRLLMEWVQENIAAFGGDADNVTLVGLSAGAHSIAHHIMNVNEKRELFHKAVIESGASTSRAVHPFDSKLHEAQFQEFLQAAGCPEGIHGREIMMFLRQLPTEIVQAAQTKVFNAYNPSIRWAWQPVIDGEIISRRPIDAWKSGDWHKVPIITGFNHNEGSMYVPKTMSQSTDFRDFFATLLPQLTPADLETLDTLYPDPAKDANSSYVERRDSSFGLGPQYKRVEAAYGQYAYVAPVRQTAQLASKGQGPPVYLYHWALQSSIANGANHGDQMWYEGMDKTLRKVSPTHEQVARYFHDYVCSFIVAGDPNAVKGASSHRPEWNAFRDGSKTMVFGEGNDERIGGSKTGVVAECREDSWARREVDFWWERSEHTEV
ncbi:hypothetical protein MBLNU230_g6273t1 [Neophaeotheca triangularis]